MTIPAGMRARDPEGATSATAAMSAVGGVVLVPWTLSTPDAGPVATVGCVAAAVGLLVAAAWLHRVSALSVDRSGVLVGLQVTGALLVAIFNVSTRDASAAAQVFVMVPVLLAASQMRAGAATVVLLVGLAGNGLTAAKVGLSGRGWLDVAVIGVALVAMTLMLVRAGNQNEVSVQALSRQVSTDELTGLLRRATVDARLRDYLTRDETAILLVDVDHFKNINDTFGHAAGDEALVHLAGVLRGQLRRSDCVAGRIGGDELVIVLPGCSTEALDRRAADVVAAVRAAPLHLADGTEVVLTVSVGVAHSTSPEMSPAVLLAAADAALYQAKARGRDTYVVASPAAGRLTA